MPGMPKIQLAPEVTELETPPGALARSLGLVLVLSFGIFEEEDSCSSSSSKLRSLWLADRTLHLEVD